MEIEEIKKDAKNRLFRTSTEEEIKELDLKLGQTYDIAFVSFDLGCPIVIEDVQDFEAKLYTIEELKEDAIIFNNNLKTKFDMAFYFVNELGHDSYQLIENCKVKLSVKQQIQHIS